MESTQIRPIFISLTKTEEANLSGGDSSINTTVITGANGANGASVNGANGANANGANGESVVRIGANPVNAASVRIAALRQRSLPNRVRSILQRVLPRR